MVGLDTHATMGMDATKKEASYLKKKKDEITIRSSAAEYLTYVASVGDQQDSIEMRYEDENIWLTQKMIYPFTELHRALRIDFKTNRNNHFQRIMICVVVFSISGSYSKFSNNWILL